MLYTYRKETSRNDFRYEIGQNLFWYLFPIYREINPTILADLNLWRFEFGSNCFWSLICTVTRVSSKKQSPTSRQNYQHLLSAGRKRTILISDAAGKVHASIIVARKVSDVCRDECARKRFSLFSFSIAFRLSPFAFLEVKFIAHRYAKERLEQR
jgi:hypothetical protein